MENKRTVFLPNGARILRFTFELLIVDIKGIAYLISSHMFTCVSRAFVDLNGYFLGSFVNFFVYVCVITCLCMYVYLCNVYVLYVVYLCVTCRLT